MGTRLADLWQSSALIQGIMALTALFAIVYLALTAQPVPEVLVATLSVIIGFYFGQKNAVNRTT